MHAWIAGPPATEPITAATTGTFDSMSTSINHQALPSGRYVRPISSKCRTLPPAASSRRTRGTFHSRARSLAASSEPIPPPAPPEPPRTVKSPAVRTILRPSTRAVPSTTARGVKDLSSLSS